MDAARPVFDHCVEPAAARAIWVQGPAGAVAASILNPVSFDELSDQERLIWLEDTAEAIRLEGAAGAMSGVVALARLELAELPALL